MFRWRRTIPRSRNPGADRVDPFAQVLEHFHASDLRSDVKVQTDDFQMAQSLQRGDHAVDLGVRDAEFVIGFAGRYVPVRHRVDVWIDAQRDASSASHSLRDGVDRFHFGGRFAVEREDILSERVFDFAVGFPDAGENRPLGRKARLDRRADLVPADAVGSESRLSYRFDDAGIEVGLPARNVSDSRSAKLRSRPSRAYCAADPCRRSRTAWATPAVVRYICVLPYSEQSVVKALQRPFFVLRVDQYGQAAVAGLRRRSS